MSGCARVLAVSNERMHRSDWASCLSCHTHTNTHGRTKPPTYKQGLHITEFLSSVSHPSLSIQHNTSCQIASSPFACRPLFLAIAASPPVWDQHLDVCRCKAAGKLSAWVSVTYTHTHTHTHTDSQLGSDTGASRSVTWSPHSELDHTLTINTWRKVNSENAKGREDT